jgi:hypothetical protein
MAEGDRLEDEEDEQGLENFNSNRGCRLHARGPLAAEPNELRPRPAQLLGPNRRCRQQVEQGGRAAVHRWETGKARKPANCNSGRLSHLMIWDAGRGRRGNGLRLVSTLAGAAAPPPRPVFLVITASASPTVAWAVCLQPSIGGVLFSALCLVLVGEQISARIGSTCAWWCVFLEVPAQKASHLKTNGAAGRLICAIRTSQVPDTGCALRLRWPLWPLPSWVISGLVAVVVVTSGHRMWC